MHVFVLLPELKLSEAAGRAAVQPAQNGANSAAARFRVQASDLWKLAGPVGCGLMGIL